MPHPPPRLIAGAMSGTSADGVDVALTRIDGAGLAMRADLVRHHHRPYDRALRDRIFAVRGSGQTSLADLTRLARDVSLAYAAAINDALRLANLTAADVTAVAAHGQTLYHAPPDTIQWLDPALVAAETRCQVVSDFRRADCAAGGQGAPLVPFADHVLFRHPEKSRLLLNLGGIANLTYLPAGGSPDELIAFDTGPANCVSDWLCRTHEPAGPGYDPHGERAARGTPAISVALAASRSEYGYRPPPKSTDGPAMIATYEAAKAATGFTGSFEDELATACLFAVHSIVFSLDLLMMPHYKVAERRIRWRHGGVDEVLVSGGGTRNQTLMAQLRAALTSRSKAEVVTLDDVTAQAKEALAFALLAAATLDGLPSNVPSCTGASRPVVLGSITPKP